MKKDIHPPYYHDAKVICACGNTFTTGSTVKEIHVEICSACHPFFTGKSKVVDTAGRVERFKKIMGKKSQVSKTRAQSGREKLASKALKRKKKGPKSELLLNEKFTKKKS